MVLRACLQGKLPIINISGGTEVGGCIFTGTPNHPMNSGLVLPSGARASARTSWICPAKACRRAKSAELVLRHASIGLTKSLVEGRCALYRKLLEYACPVFGCMATLRCVDVMALYYILGRSDDTIKISGKRTGPSELEGILIGTGKVSEAAVFGIPHPVKGSAIVCACVLDARHERRRVNCRTSSHPLSSTAWAHRTGRRR